MHAMYIITVIDTSSGIGTDPSGKARWRIFTRNLPFTSIVYRELPPWLDLLSVVICSS